MKGNHSGELKSLGGNISSGNMALNTSFFGSKKQDAIVTVPSRLIMIDLHWMECIRSVHRTSA